MVKVRIARSKKSPGTLKFVVRGKKGAFAPQALPIRGTFVVDSPLARTGQCGEAGPTCRTIARGRVIACK